MEVSTAIQQLSFGASNNLSCISSFFFLKHSPESLEMIELSNVQSLNCLNILSCCWVSGCRPFLIELCKRVSFLLLLLYLKFFFFIGLIGWRWIAWWPNFSYYVYENSTVSPVTYVDGFTIHATGSRPSALNQRAHLFIWSPRLCDGASGGQGEGRSMVDDGPIRLTSRKRGLSFPFSTSIAWIHTCTDSIAP